MTARGAIAAGHPVSARIGADVLADGGNAVDAAVASMLTSFVTEPLLTGLGSGGYLMVVPPGGEPTLLDFFVETPGRGADPATAAPLRPVVVSFGDAAQVFHVGPASCGTYGTPAGIAAAVERFGTVPLADLTAPAARLARAGVPVVAAQAYLFSLLAGIVTSTPEARARYLTASGTVPGEGDHFRDPELADALDRFGAEGAAPFYTGDVGRAVADRLAAAGGTLTGADLAAYRVVEREPVRVRYRGREIVTNPPPSAGGILLAYALALLDREPGPPDETALVRVMAAAQDARTVDFLDDLDMPGFGLAALIGSASRLGSTTHVSAIDADGWACSVTCTNGEGSGIVVPGTGLHLNNVLGEEDLSPHGFGTHPVGRRLPSMMAPTVVLRDGVAELALGSAGSNRIRSALLAVITNVIDKGMPAQRAVDAPRLHFEDGVLYAEPDQGLSAFSGSGFPITRFGARNLFFGGCQAVCLDVEHKTFSGGGDPRRGGASIVV